MADVTITHPVSSNQAKLNRTSRLEGAAAQDAEAAKQRRYRRASRSLGMPFFPIAVESFGRWGKSALWCIRDKAAMYPPCHELGGQGQQAPKGSHSPALVGGEP